MVLVPNVNLLNKDNFVKSSEIPNSRLYLFDCRLTVLWSEYPNACCSTVEQHISQTRPYPSLSQNS